MPSLRRPRRLAVATLAACVAALAAAAGPAQAHDTWLLEDLRARTPTSVSLHLTSGERFARAETSIRPERIEAAACRAGATTAALDQRTPEPRALRLGGVLPGPGLWQCAVQLAPRPIELSRAKVAEYLADIHAPPAIRRQWQALAKENGGRWRELYRKQAKTYVARGDGGERGWSEPSGLPLEIVPEVDPTLLRPGQRLTVRVLKAGRPLPGLPLGLARDGGAAERFVVTDAEGGAAIVLPRAGTYLLHATELRRVGRAEADWESDFTTFAFRVSAAR